MKRKKAKKANDGPSKKLKEGRQARLRTMRRYCGNQLDAAAEHVRARFLSAIPDEHRQLSQVHSVELQGVLSVPENMSHLPESSIESPTRFVATISATFPTVATNVASEGSSGADIDLQSITSTPADRVFFDCSVSRSLVALCADIVRRFDRSMVQQGGAVNHTASLPYLADLDTCWPLHHYHPNSCTRTMTYQYFSCRCSGVNFPHPTPLKEEVVTGCLTHVAAKSSASWGPIAGDGPHFISEFSFFIDHNHVEGIKESQSRWRGTQRAGGVGCSEA